MECMGCFSDTRERLLPCQHAMCKECSDKWFMFSKSSKCPMCRSQVLRHSSFVPSSSDVLVCVQLPIGITLRNCRNGCKISKVIPGCEAHRSKLKPEMTLTHVNGIRVEGHEHGILMMSSCEREGVSFHVTVLKSPKNTKPRKVEWCSIL